MATLKEHQAAMVDLLANGSGIPASASRLAHAMHDVLLIVNNLPFVRPVVECGEGGLPERPFLKRNDSTTPGLNDKALSKPQKALKTDSPAKWPTPAEQRVKELENTIRQLRANNAKLKAEVACQINNRDMYKARCESLEAQLPEQAGCRNGEQALGLGVSYAELGMKYAELVKILEFYGVDDLDKARAEYLKYRGSQEQAGCRKEDTQVCEHIWQQAFGEDFRECIKCQTIEDIYE